MKKLIVILFVFVSSFGFSQVNTFNVAILPNGTNPSGALNVVEIDTGYVIVGFSPLGTMVVSFIDSIGNLTDSKIYSRPNYSYDTGVEQTLKKLKNKNEYIFSCAASTYDTSNTYESTLIVKFDSKFDTIYTKEYFTGTGSIQGGKLFEEENGNYVISGYNLEDLLLYSTDSLGSLLWQKHFGGSYVEQGTQLIKTIDKGYLVGGKSHSFGNNSPYHNGEWYIVKTDSLGNQEWDKHYGNPLLNDELIWDMINTVDSCYLLAGSYTYEASGSSLMRRSRLVKVDQNGNIIWDKRYGTKQYDNFIKNLIQKDNGDIITVSLNDSIVNCYSYASIIHCLNSEGEVKWRRKYYFNNDPCTFWSTFYAFNLTKDNGYIFTGIGTDLNLTPSQYTWIVKADSLGFDHTFYSGDTTLAITLVTDTVCYGDSALVYFHLTGKSAPYSLELDNGNIHNSIYYPLTYESYAIDSMYIYPQDSLSNQQIIATLTDPFGEVVIDTFEVYIQGGCLTSKQNSKVSIKEIKIYPNPTTGIIRIKNTECSIQNVSVFDIYGRKVLKTEVGSSSHPEALEGGQECEVDLSTRPKGIYIIKVQTDKGVAVEKVILH